MTTYHTPTPWKVWPEEPVGNEHLSKRCAIVIKSQRPYGWRNICRMPDVFNGNRDAETDANGEFICRAVNCHDQLVTTLGESLGLLAGNPTPEAIDSVRAMLAAALDAAHQPVATPAPR